jgi:hypothetical protein
MPHWRGQHTRRARPKARPVLMAQAMSPLPPIPDPVKQQKPISGRAFWSAFLQPIITLERRYWLSIGLTLILLSLVVRWLESL